jgi:hypothetical protein
MGKENFNGYEYKNISTHTLPYPLTTLILIHSSRSAPFVQTGKVELEEDIISNLPSILL